MQAIDTLVHEHEVIEEALTLLGKVTQRARAGFPAPDGFAAWMIQFIRAFADGYHHQKEELALFPLLERRGVPKEGGPLGCMLHEHELGRELTRAMETAQSQGDLARFADAAEEYIVLLREHIFKENVVLFRIAERCLHPGDDETLVSQFRAVDIATTPQRESRRYLEEIKAWTQDLVEASAGPAGPATRPQDTSLPIIAQAQC